jgi:hypothetical protein
MMTEEFTEEFADVFDEEEETVSDVPMYGSQEWSDYVLSQLSTDEKDSQGRPKCDGLRRVMHQLFDVIHSKSVERMVVNGEPIFTWELCFMPRKTYVFDSTMIPSVTVTGTASANPTNVNRPFDRFLAAMADTRSESRALKRGLLLNCVTSEEMQEAEVEEVGEASAGQLKMVSFMLSNLGIDKDKFLKHHRKDISKMKGPKIVLESLGKADLSKALVILNKYQSNNDTSVPPEILN